MTHARSLVSNRFASAFALVLFLASAAAAQTFTALHSFSGPDGNNSGTSLIQATNGNLYGTTVYGGSSNNGVVFGISPSGTITSVYGFNGTNGSQLFSSVVQGGSGSLFATTYFGGANNLGTFFTIQGSTPVALHSFASSDGSPSQGGIIRAGDGNFYGTTLNGGAYGSGTVYKVTPAGVLTVLHNFTRSGGEGGNPYEALLEASDGNFYGTTWDGGSFDHGTIFKITPGGTFTTLYQFCLSDPATCPDGYNPQGALMQGADGALYGTTTRGGNTVCFINEYQGCGTIFRIGTTGAFTQLHRFDGSDGAGPTWRLTQGTDGNFYGITYYLGPNTSCPNGCGTIYNMTPSGTVTTLYAFCSATACADGYGLGASPIQDTNGAFYGTTGLGGAYGKGVVYSLDMGLGPFVSPLPKGGTVGTPVTILGTNLTGVTSVTFNGTPATITGGSTSEIATTVPAGATTGNIQVVTSSGTLTSNVVFRVIP